MRKFRLMYSTGNIVKNMKIKFTEILLGHTLNTKHHEAMFSRPDLTFTYSLRETSANNV
jgi:hypothetical protein